MRRFRTTLLAIPLLCTATLACGQVTLGPNGPVPVKPVQPETPNQPAKPAPPPPPRRDQPRQIPLRVTPVAEPSPPLRYSLVPKYLDQTPGNSVPFYYRAVLQFQSRRETFDQRYETLEQWRELPLDQLPRDEVRTVINLYGPMFSDLKTASLRETTDWGWRLRDLSGRDAISFLLPEIQDSRFMAQLLALKARLEIAEGRFEDAVETLTIGYKLAVDVAEPPTIINDLVGIAIASILNEQLRTLIAAPDAPNLYWAMAELPTPLIDMQPALRYEMTFPLRFSPYLRDPEQTDHTAGEWANLIAAAVPELERLGGPIALLAGSGSGTSAPPPPSRESRASYRNWPARLAALGMILRGYPLAKQALIDAGMPRGRVEAMPVGQVVAIHDARLSRHVSQELYKWTLLPSPQAQAGIRESRDRLKAEGYYGSPGRTREVIPITSVLLPALEPFLESSLRLEVRLKGLRVVEAIRMYAAEHDGRLPDALDQITAVPVPVNPATGQPFEYQNKGETATLKIPVHPPSQSQNDWHLEITIAK